MSFAELLLIGLVAVAFLKPDEMVGLMNWAGKIFSSLRRQFGHSIGFGRKVQTDDFVEQEVIKYTIDQNGNLQTVYNLDLIKPYLKPTKNNIIANGSKTKQKPSNKKTKKDSKTAT